MGSNCCKGDVARPIRSNSSIYSRSRAGATLDDRFTTSDDAGGVRLTVSAARTGDSGVYTLQASNAAGQDTARLRLEVSPDEAPTGDDPPTFLRRLQDLTVKVGTRTRFLVEIVSSTECKVTWFRNERRLMEAERVSLARDGNFWCADLATVSVDDAGRWTCTAENTGGRASCSAHLNVLVPKAYKRPEFVEELRALLTEQGTVSLECKVVGVPTPVLRWFKDSREIKAGDVFALTANAEDPTSLGTYTCEAVNCMGRAYSSSKVHVVGRSREGSARPTHSSVAPEPPPIFTKELEDQAIRICEPLTLSCQLVVPPWPRTVVWYNKEGKIEPNERHHVLEDGVGGYLLEVPSAEWPDEGEWKCVATSSGGRVGISTCYVSMDVPKNYRKPRFMENLQAVLTEEGLVSFECKVVGFPTPVLSWFKDGQELKPGDVYQLTGTNSLGSYCCIARNCMGQASSSAELTVEDIQNQLNEEEKLQLFTKNQAPKFIQGLKSMEAKIDEPFCFTIKVAIPPEPSVLWYRDDQPVDESTRCHLGKEDRGIFSLDIQNLEFLDQAEWKCVAMNDFGHSVTSCFLKLIIPRHYKKPRFLENLQAILSDEGAVNLECKVIGVPQPVLKWYKDGEELKPGDIHRIISGQDGTCCLGTYTCEAQNCMGIAASSASLLGFDDSMKAKSKKKAEEQALDRNLSLSTIHEERTSQMYDTPVGDITLDDKGEISFSFDGKEVSVSLYETPDLTEEEALQIVEMYADQLSENVTEHNVVELPPLRFVKETSTSGNLLMEAIIIDVSPDYFVSPEEDLRTEADVEDISIADENGPPQLSLDQDIGGEDYLEKTMALLSEEKADIPLKITRKKSDSQVQSGDDYFSLSREQSISEERRDDDTQVISESDLQSFASARSSDKPKSKSPKPDEDGQESSEPTKTILIKDEVQKHSKELVSNPIKPKRERKNSRGSRRSSSGSEKSLGKKEELSKATPDARIDPILDPTKTYVAELSQEQIMSHEEFLNTMSSINLSLTKVINDIQIIERDIILKSELMSSAATASRSLEIINSLITPLLEIHSIADAVKDTVSESKELSCTLFNNLPEPLKKLQQSLTIIDKCIDVESDNKTLVKRTCLTFVENCGEEILQLISKINSLTTTKYLNVDDKLLSEIISLANDISRVIKYSEETIKSRNLSNAAGEIEVEKPSIEAKHVRETQKAIFELKNPLVSIVKIIESADSSKVSTVAKIKNSEVILNDMSASIQDLQKALEQIESLSVKESTSSLQKYNTDIIETVMEPVLKLRILFEQLSSESVPDDDNSALKDALLSIKSNISEISSKIESVENNIGTFDILQSENKLEALQRMAQILIALENNLPRLEIIPNLKNHVDIFHKNLTKVLENVIESNEAKKYFTLMEICDAVNRINSSIKSMDTNIIFHLASFKNTLRIIQDQFVSNVFEPELNCIILNNIRGILSEAQITINNAEELSAYEDMEQVKDMSLEKLKVTTTANALVERIDHTIAAIHSVKAIETTTELKASLIPSLEHLCPILEELKRNIAPVNIGNVLPDDHVSDISEFSNISTLAVPLYQLNQNIIVLNQILAENVDGFKECGEMISSIAEPLLELHTTLEVMQQDVISQYAEDVTPYEVNVNIASAVQNLQSCIVMIQEQGGIEALDDMSTLEDISGIKTTADTLPSDRLVLPIAEEITTEQSIFPMPQNIPEIATATAQALQTLSKHITVLQNPEILETLETLSEVSDYSSLKSVAIDLGELHSGIEEILQPVLIENSNDLTNLMNISKLMAVTEPMHDLQQCLSILETSNIPIFENILDISTEKIHSVLKSIADFKEHLNMCIESVLPIVETTEKTKEISSKIELLREKCGNLKITIDSLKFVGVQREVVALESIIDCLLNTTNKVHWNEMDQIKGITKELYEKIITVQEGLMPFTPKASQDLAIEAKLIETINEIEHNIAALQQYDFVDLTHVSDMTSCTSPQLAFEVETESLLRIDEIAQNSVNVAHASSQEIPIADLMIIEDFFKTCKNEFSILRCLISTPMSHKKIIRLLQEFNVLQITISDIKSKRAELKLSHDVNACLENFLIHAKESLESVQSSLVKIVSTQIDLLFKTPAKKLENANDILSTYKQKMGSDKVIDEFLNEFYIVINEVKIWLENSEEDVINELKYPCSSQLTTDYQSLQKIEDIRLFIEEQKKLPLNYEVRDILTNILDCIMKHQDCKNATGTGKMLILTKCISDCIDILQEKVSGKETIKPEIEDSAVNVVLTEIIEPLEAFHDHLISVQDQFELGMPKDSISIDVASPEAFTQTTTEIDKDIIQSSVDKPATSDNLFIMESDQQMHSIRDSMESLDNVQGIEIPKNISEPIQVIDKSLHSVLSLQSSENGGNIPKVKTDQLVQHIDQYIELIEIVEEISAIIKIEDLKESVDVATKLRESITSSKTKQNSETGEEFHEINLEQIQLAYQLQKAISAMYVQVLDNAHELAPALSADILQKVAKITSQLQADLVAVTGVNVPVQAPTESILENTKIFDYAKSCEADSSLIQPTTVVDSLKPVVLEQTSVIDNEALVNEKEVQSNSINVECLETAETVPQDMVVIQSTETENNDNYGELNSENTENASEISNPALLEQKEIIKQETVISIVNEETKFTGLEQKSSITDIMPETHDIPSEDIKSKLPIGKLVEHLTEYISQDIENVVKEHTSLVNIDDFQKTVNLAKKLLESLTAYGQFIASNFTEDKITCEQAELAQQLQTGLSILQQHALNALQQQNITINTELLEHIGEILEHLQLNLATVINAVEQSDSDQINAHTNELAPTDLEISKEVKSGLLLDQICKDKESPVGEGINKEDTIFSDQTALSSILTEKQVSSEHLQLDAQSESLFVEIEHHKEEVLTESLDVDKDLEPKLFEKIAAIERTDSMFQSEGTTMSINQFGKSEIETLVECIETYLSEDIVQVVEGLSEHLSMHEIEKSVRLAKELRECIAAIETNVTEAGPLTSLELTDKKEELIQELKDTLSTLQLQALENAEKIFPKFDKDVLCHVANVASQFSTKLTVVETPKVPLVIKPATNIQEQNLIPLENVTRLSDILLDNKQIQHENFAVEYSTDIVPTSKDDVIEITEVVAAENINLLQKDDNDIACAVEATEKPLVLITPEIQTNSRIEQLANVELLEQINEPKSISETFLQNIDAYLSEDIVQVINEIAAATNVKELNESIDVARELRNVVTAISFNDLSVDQQCLTQKLETSLSTVLTYIQDKLQVITQGTVAVNKDILQRTLDVATSLSSELKFAIISKASEPENQQHQISYVKNQSSISQLNQQVQQIDINKSTEKEANERQSTLNEEDLTSLQFNTEYETADISVEEQSLVAPAESMVVPDVEHSKYMEEKILSQEQAITTAFETLLQSIDNYLLEDIVDVVDELSTLTNIDELKQSINVARELRQNIAALEAETTEKTSIVEGQIMSEHGCLVENLQRALNIIQANVLENTEKLPPIVNKDVSLSLSNVVVNLSNNLSTIISQSAAQQLPSENSENVEFSVAETISEIMPSENNINIKEVEQELYAAAGKSLDLGTIEESQPMKEKTIPVEQVVEIIETNENENISVTINPEPLIQDCAPKIFDVSGKEPDLIDALLEENKVIGAQMLEDKLSFANIGIILQNIDAFLLGDTGEVVNELCIETNFEALKQSIAIAKELRENIAAIEIEVLESDKEIQEKIKVDNTVLASQLQNSLSIFQIEAVENLPLVENKEKLQHVAGIAQNLSNQLDSLAMLQTPVQIIEDIKKQEDALVTDVSEIVIHTNESPENIKQDIHQAHSISIIAQTLEVDAAEIKETVSGERTEHLELEAKDKTVDEINLKKDSTTAAKEVAPVTGFVETKPMEATLDQVPRTATETLIHNIETYLKEDVVEVINELSMTSNVDALKQSLNLARELCENIVSVDVTQPLEVVSPINDSPITHQMRLAREFYDTLQSIQVLVIESSECPNITKDALIHVGEVISHLSTDLVNIFDSNQDISSIKDNEIEGFIHEPIKETTCQEIPVDKDITDLTAQQQNIEIEKIQDAIESDRKLEDFGGHFTENTISTPLENVKTILEAVETCQNKVGVQKNLNAAKFENNAIVQHLDEFISNEMTEIVGELSRAAEIEELKESIILATELRQSVVSALEENGNVEITQAYQVELAQKLQKALTILHTKSLDSAEILAPMIGEHTLQKVSEAVTHLQEDLDVAVICHSVEIKTTDIISEIGVEQNSIIKLDDLLQDLSNEIDSAMSKSPDQDNETLRDILDEIQTVIIKLKRDYDGAVNDTLNETLEDLECSVRSVQLQINEDSPPNLLKEAYDTLQLLVNNMKETQNVAILEPKYEKNSRENLIEKCCDNADETIKLLDLASNLNIKSESKLDNIVMNLNCLKDNIKQLRCYFIGNVENVIERGIDISASLDQIEDKVFSLEKDLDNENNIDAAARDSILTAIHSVYGSISNMRSAISSIQKQYMFENFGKPSENILRSLKNVNIILSKNYKNIIKGDWKFFSKTLRKVLNHFEDIKFYINLDKTARLPSDAAFTKIILHELKSIISEAILPQTFCLDSDLNKKVFNCLQSIEKSILSIESKSTLEVREKIPLFKDVACEILKVTDLIKIELENITEEEQNQVFSDALIASIEEEIIKDKEFVVFDETGSVNVVETKESCQANNNNVDQQSLISSTDITEMVAVSSNNHCIEINTEVEEKPTISKFDDEKPSIRVGETVDDLEATAKIDSNNQTNTLDDVETKQITSDDTALCFTNDKSLDKTSENAIIDEVKTLKDVEEACSLTQSFQAEQNSLSCKEQIKDTIEYPPPDIKADKSLSKDDTYLSIDEKEVIDSPKEDESQTTLNEPIIDIKSFKEADLVLKQESTEKLEKVHEIKVTEETDDYNTEKRTNMEELLIEQKGQRQEVVLPQMTSKHLPKEQLLDCEKSQENNAVASLMQSQDELLLNAKKNEDLEIQQNQDEETRSEVKFELKVKSEIESEFNIVSLQDADNKDIKLKELVEKDIVLIENKEQVKMVQVETEHEDQIEQNYREEENNYLTAEKENLVAEKKQEHIQNLKLEKDLNKEKEHFEFGKHEVKLEQEENVNDETQDKKQYQESESNLKFKSRVEQKEYAGPTLRHENVEEEKELERNLHKPETGQICEESGLREIKREESNSSEVQKPKLETMDSEKDVKMEEQTVNQEQKKETETRLRIDLEDVEKDNEEIEKTESIQRKKEETSTNNVQKEDKVSLTEEKVECKVLKIEKERETNVESKTKEGTLNLKIEESELKHQQMEKTNEVCSKIKKETVCEAMLQEEQLLNQETDKEAEKSIKVEENTEKDKNEYKEHKRKETETIEENKQNLEVCLKPNENIDKIVTNKETEESEITRSLEKESYLKKDENVNIAENEENKLKFGLLENKAEATCCTGENERDSLINNQKTKQQTEVYIKEEYEASLSKKDEIIPTKKEKQTNDRSMKEENNDVLDNNQESQIVNLENEKQISEVHQTNQKEELEALEIKDQNELLGKERKDSKELKVELEQKDEENVVRTTKDMKTTKEKQETIFKPLEEDELGAIKQKETKNLISDIKKKETDGAKLEENVSSLDIEKTDGNMFILPSTHLEKENQDSNLQQIEEPEIRTPKEYKKSDTLDKDAEDKKSTLEQEVATLMKNKDDLTKDYSENKDILLKQRESDQLVTENEKKSDKVVTTEEEKQNKLKEKKEKVQLTKQKDSKNKKSENEMLESKKEKVERKRSTKKEDKIPSNENQNDDEILITTEKKSETKIEPKIDTKTHLQKDEECEAGDKNEPINYDKERNLDKENKDIMIPEKEKEIQDSNVKKTDLKKHVNNKKEVTETVSNKKEPNNNETKQKTGREETDEVELVKETKDMENLKLEEEILRDSEIKQALKEQASLKGDIKIDNKLQETKIEENNQDKLRKSNKGGDKAEERVKNEKEITETKNRIDHIKQAEKNQELKLEQKEDASHINKTELQFENEKQDITIKKIMKDEKDSLKSETECLTANMENESLKDVSKGIQENEDSLKKNKEITKEVAIEKVDKKSGRKKKKEQITKTKEKSDTEKMKIENEENLVKHATNDQVTTNIEGIESVKNNNEASSKKEIEKVVDIEVETEKQHADHEKKKNQIDASLKGEKEAESIEKEKKNESEKHEQTSKEKSDDINLTEIIEMKCKNKEEHAKENQVIESNQKVEEEVNLKKDKHKQGHQEEESEKPDHKLTPTQLLDHSKNKTADSIDATIEHVQKQDVIQQHQEQADEIKEAGVQIKKRKINKQEKEKETDTQSLVKENKNKETQETGIQIKDSKTNLMEDKVSESIGTDKNNIENDAKQKLEEESSTEYKKKQKDVDTKLHDKNTSEDRDSVNNKHEEDPQRNQQNEIMNKKKKIKKVTKDTPKEPKGVSQLVKDQDDNLSIGETAIEKKETDTNQKKNEEHDQNLSRYNTQDLQFNENSKKETFKEEDVKLQKAKMIDEKPHDTNLLENNTELRIKEHSSKEILIHDIDVTRQHPTEQSVYNKIEQDNSRSCKEKDSHYNKEYYYEPSTKIKHEVEERPRFVDRNHRDYTLEFTRPSGYRERTFDSHKPETFSSTLGRNATIYKAQSIELDAQLRSSAPSYQDLRSSEPPERRSEIRLRSKALSEARSTLSERRTMSRDIKRKPVFSTYLTDRTAVEGSRVKLTCSVLSSTDPTVTWYRNGTLLDDKLKYRTKVIEGLITLEVLNAVPSDSAEYSCMVENENGSVSTSANLKVYPSFEASPIPPTFTRSIRDTYHIAENELVLECRIRGQPLPTISWMKDDQVITSNERCQAFYLADGVCRLAISHPTPEDSGKYTCKAENSVWCDKISHVVNFTGKESRLSPNLATIERSRFNRQAMESRRPHFTNVLTDYKVVKGGTIGLQVEIRGAPTRVEWLREGRSVTEIYRNARTFVEQGLYTLALSDVTEKETGLYTCRAWSTHGNVDMNAAITVVSPNEMDGKPAVIVGRPEKDILISVGEDVNISFRVQGEPKPKVIFMKGIRDITSSQRVCKMTSDDYVKFTLKRSVVSDAGTYCILARNAYGCDRAFVTVVVRQRASSDNLISDWTYPMDDSALSIADRRYMSVPNRIPGEPSVVDGGNNWISLAWPKPDPGAAAPVLAYKIESWLIGKDGGARWMELGITPLNSFDAFNLKQGEEYHFRVTPRNRYGWGESVQTSSPIGIGQSGDRPEFVEILPGQLKVLAGETANLSCSVKGKPVPEIVWMKNGHEIEEEGTRVMTSFNGYNCSLVVSNINIEDEARYSCEATNVHGRASTYARLAVVTDRQIWEADVKLKRERSQDAEGEFPPQFTMRLRDRRVQATYPVRLTCQVVGSPPPTVTWFKDGEEVVVDSRHTKYQDELFHTLEIAPTTLEDGGVYEVMARNTSGAVSCRCSLVVDKGIRAYVAPEFCCGLEPLYRLNEGEELRISAVIEAYPSVGVTWYRDGVRLRPSRRAIMTLDRDGQIELALASVTGRDSGVYTCTASNEVGKASTSGKVEVIEGEQASQKTPPMVFSPDVPYSKEPIFIRKPRSSEAWEGDTVIIECEVTGDPKPDVYWLRDFLKPDYYRDATHFKRVGAGPEYRFEIPHAKLDYTGAYSVVAKNQYGEAKAIISLQILAKDPTCADETHNIRYGRVDVIPRFEKELTDLLSYDGDAVEFECRVSGNPEPDVRWFHYTEIIRDCPDFESSYDGSTIRFKIKQVTAEDEGTYTCEASNSLGKAKSSACLVVYPPGEPNTLSQRLRRPPALLSATSTPRSTPRSTPARSVSRTPGPEPMRLCSPSRQLPPKFYTYPFNKVAEEGDSVVFQCAVKGLPHPWTTWDKDGLVITPSSRITIREKDELMRILEIEQVTIEDVGLYRITVENEFGRAEACARLEVITQKGKFYGGVRAYSASPRRSTSYRRRLPSISRQD